MKRATSYLEGKEITKREWEILCCWSEGLDRKQTGKKLFIEETTVKTHATRIFRKLGARNQAHAVAIAFRKDLIG